MIGTSCTLGRAPRTKETLPDFHEWCHITRHPRIFRGLTGCQRTPGKWGVTSDIACNLVDTKEFKIQREELLQITLLNQALVLIYQQHF